MVGSVKRGSRESCDERAGGGNGVIGTETHLILQGPNHCCPLVSIVTSTS